MNVVCIGSGYVGSVTGTAFAVLGHKTTVIDIDQKKVDLINEGRSPIFEPGLNSLIKNYIGKTLFATSSYDVVNDADVVFIGVGTPSKADGTADLTYIELAAKSIGEYLNKEKFTVIVNKSTVPVGTGERVTAIIEEISGLKDEEDFVVISNPEFLREGYALEDVFFPDRIVIGTNNEKARRIMRKLYKDLLERTFYEALYPEFEFPFNPDAPKAKYFETDTKSAEMIKYASNSFLAVKISFINEIARLCESLGSNALEVAKGMGLDSRIGDKFLQVSSGWSGSCFPKDTAEILATSYKFGQELSIVKAAVESNIQMHQFCVDKVERCLGNLKGKIIGVLGLTFKPNTDDARKTQSSYIIKKLVEMGAEVKVHDPQGMETFKSLNQELPITYCQQPEEVAVNGDALLLLTHWDEYLHLDWEKIYGLMNTPYILDTRNVLPLNELKTIGFISEGLGIGN